MKIDWEIIMNDKLSDSEAKLREIIAEQLLTITALNSCIGGEDSLTTDNLTTVSRLENEIEDLKHDIGEYIKISNELANDIIQTEVKLKLTIDTLKYVDMWMKQTILDKGNSTIVEDLMTVRIKETLEKIEEK